MNTESRAVLERLVDASTLGAVLTELAEICALKAQHIRETWQDDPLARQWEKAARRVIAAAGSEAVVRLP